MRRNSYFVRVLGLAAIAAFVVVFAFGCATTEQVKKAQATADEALRVARDAEGKADSAVIKAGECEEAAKKASAEADRAASAATSFSINTCIITENIGEGD